MAERSGDRRAAGVCVGVIGAPRGLRGEVRVRSYTADPDAIAAYGALSDEAGTRQFRMRIVGHHKEQVIARFDGVDDRTAAEALNGVRLFLPREALPEPEDDEEYYHVDLIGLTVETVDGSPLGRVRGVDDFGAGDVLDVVDPEGRSLLVPFTRAVVPVVDLENGRIVIDPPPGLLEGPDEGEDDE